MPNRHVRVAPIEAGVVHAEWFQYLAFHVGREVLTGTILDQQFEQVEAGIGINEAFAGCGNQSEVFRQVGGERWSRGIRWIACAEISQPDTGAVRQ